MTTLSRSDPRCSAPLRATGHSQRAAPTEVRGRRAGETCPDFQHQQVNRRQGQPGLAGIFPEVPFLWACWRFAEPGRRKELGEDMAHEWQRPGRLGGTAQPWICVLARFPASWHGGEGKWAHAAGASMPGWRFTSGCGYGARGPANYEAHPSGWLLFAREATGQAVLDLSSGLAPAM